MNKDLRVFLSPLTRTKHTFTTIKPYTIMSTVVCFTGTFSKPRKHFSDLATGAGYKVAGSITKAVNLVVIGEDAGKKETAARAAGLECIDEAEFFERVGSSSPSSSPAAAAAAAPKRKRGAVSRDNDDDEEDEEEEEEEEEAPKPKRARAAPKAAAPKAAAAKKAAPAAAKGNSNDPSSHVVVFSGTLPSGKTRTAATAEAVAAGYTVAGSFSGKTTILVAAGDAGAKLAKAQKQGCLVLDEGQWQARLAGGGGDGDNDDAMDVEDGEDEEEAPASSILVQQPNVTTRDLAANIGLRETGDMSINGVAPLRVMRDGEEVAVPSSSSSAVHRVKRTSDHYYCTCMAWRMQKDTPTDRRTCKHLKEVLGDEYESVRIGDTPASAAAGSTETNGTEKDPSRSRRAAAATKSRSESSADMSIEVLLAKKWEETTDPTGWHCSEKLDGVRAYWCPRRRKFFSRTHNEYFAPEWFTEHLPNDMILDGELFCGRGQFQSTVSIVRTVNSDERWRSVQYQIFDIPSLVDESFEKRMVALKAFTDKVNHRQIKAVPQEKIRNKEHMLRLLDAVQKQGGEGLMLRQPKSKYANGRSSTLLKVKTFYDGEAEVIEHQLSTSATYRGKLGALVCRMASGKTFRVGTGFSADQRNLDKAPSVGSLIVYKTQELTRDGIPRFPVFLGVAAPDKTGPMDPVFAVVVAEGDE
ncbi:hypothetical protein BC828DRAFT_375541 [Blastocladiella britannica]|nr:hypothetical protein BC828DRAFT_375541 [Blastocladiella britannica]